MLERKREREKCADDRGASALHLFMFVFMVRHGNGNWKNARKRCLRRRFRIGFTMLKFSENKSALGPRWCMSSSARLSVATMSCEYRWRDRQWPGWWKLQLETRLNYANNFEIIEHAGVPFELRWCSMRNIVNAFKWTGTVVTARSKGDSVPIPGMFTCKISSDKQRKRVCRPDYLCIAFFFLSKTVSSFHRRLSRRRMCYRIYKAISKSASWKSLVEFTCRMSRLSDVFCREIRTSMYIELRFDDKTYVGYIFCRRKEGVYIRENREMLTEYGESRNINPQCTKVVTYCII